MPTYVILRVDDDGLHVVDDNELLEVILQKRRETAERDFREGGGARRGGEGVEQKIHGRHGDGEQRAGDDGAAALSRPANGLGSGAEFSKAIVEQKREGAGGEARDGASQMAKPDRCCATEEASDDDYYARRREFHNRYRLTREGSAREKRPANGPGSEAEFLKAIIRKKEQESGAGDGDGNGASQTTTSPDRPGTEEAAAASDYYARRREFLKSYSFKRKESLPEKARRYAGAVREMFGKLRGRRRPKKVDGGFFDREVGRRPPLEEGEEAKGEIMWRARALPARIPVARLRGKLSCMNPSAWRTET